MGNCGPNWKFNQREYINFGRYEKKLSLLETGQVKVPEAEHTSGIGRCSPTQCIERLRGEYVRSYFCYIPLIYRSLFFIPKLFQKDATTASVERMDHSLSIKAEEGSSAEVEISLASKGYRITSSFLIHETPVSLLQVPFSISLFLTSFCVVSS